MGDMQRFIFDVSTHPKCPVGLANPEILRDYPINKFLDLLEYLNLQNDLEEARYLDEENDANL